jgi:hypothetical protein
VTDDELEAAWGQVFDALPAAWSVGRPSYHDERHEWTHGLRLAPGAVALSSATMALLVPE